MANKIIVVIGPHEGVGKSTLAVNVAARYSQMRRQPVVLLDSDPLCRGEVGVIAGASPRITMVEILDQLVSKQVGLTMLRGRIPTTSLGLGVVNLAAHAKEIELLTPEQWGFFLRAFSELYDLVVDIEMASPLKTITLDLADTVIWTFLPNMLSVKSTIHQMQALHNQKYGFHKFLFALNQAGSPNALDEDQIENSLSNFDEAIDIRLPHEPELERLLNHGRPTIIDNSRSPYATGVSQITDRIARLQKDTPSGITASPYRNAPSSGGATTVAALQHHVADTMLDEKRKRWNGVKQTIHRELVDELNIRRIDLDTKGDPARERQLRTNVESTVNALITKAKELTLNREERERLVKELVDEALGLGPLEELLADPSVTEIMVNRFDQVYVERKGKITLSDKRFIDNNHVVQVVRRIIAPLGRRIDESVPMVDARLKDGSRVNAIIPPLAVQGPSITIRRFPEKAFTPDDLFRLGAINRPMLDFLRVCVLMKKNMIISGGTGTGKTTILNLMSGYIPNDERIVTVEDTAELRMQQEHVVRLESRPPNIEGQGAITIRDLVKNCLRMRPDRIVVGECRGGEALDMLQAMNTGHEGSLTTVHANTPRDAFTRLETLCLMAGMDLPVWALREQIRSAVHIVVQLSRLQDGSRKVVCITEVVGRTDETIVTEDLFRYVQDGMDPQDRVLGHHEATGHAPSFLSDLKARGLQIDSHLFDAPNGNGK